jgi:RHS repeat-associated protein
MPGGRHPGANGSGRQQRSREPAARGFELLEPRAVLAGLIHVDFSVSGLADSRCAAVPYGQRTIAVPADLALPVTVSIKGSVDDELLINNQIIQPGQFPYKGSCNGAHDVNYSFLLTSRTFELACGDNFGGTARYSLAIDFTPTPAPPPPLGEPSPAQNPGNIGVPCPGACPINDDRTSHNVNLSTGILTHRDGTTLGSSAAGVGGDTAFEWTSSAAATGSSQMFGNGWIAPGMPRIQQLASDASGPTRIAVPFSGSDVRVFVRSPAASSVYTPAFGAGSTDTLVRTGATYTFRTTSGDTLTFADFSSTAAAARGQFLEQSDTNGNRLAATLAADGSIARLDAFVAGGKAPTESQVYTVIPSGSANAGKVNRIDVKRSDGTVVQSTQYAYYSAGSSHGGAGDLKSITVLDGANRVIDIKQYRYAAATVTGRGVSLLQAVIDGEGSRRLAQSGLHFDSADNAAIKPFARDWYLFDGQGRVVRHDMQGAGCSACTAGIGAFSYDYTTNPATTAGGFNDWQTKTVETRPDGTQAITYANSRGQTMLAVTRETTGATPRQWGTFSRYDSMGLKIWQAEPSSVRLPTNLADIERYADLLHSVNGNFEYLSDSAGLIRFTDFSQTTTATDTVPGGVAGFVRATGVRNGEFGAAIVQATATYMQRTASGRTTTLPATQTVYAGERFTGARTTSYAYTWYAGTTQVQSMTESLPVVAADENGPGMPDMVTHVYDPVGREIWTRDADGFLTYSQYDAETGVVVKTIRDVSTARTADFQNLPVGWATRVGEGLHLVTTAEVDRLGRVTKAVDPAGNVTCVVYDDIGHSTRTYTGWNAATGTTTGPITVTRDDPSGTYRESLTFAASPAVANGQPTGTEAIVNLQSLTRSAFNAAGQVIAVDRYFNVSGLTYTTSPSLGTEGVHFLRTRYAYNNQGLVSRVQTPAGTITRSVYDPLARLTSTWVGTNDTTTNGFTWSPTNATGSSNLIQVAAFEYDNGGVGNGNLTRVVEFPGTVAGVTNPPRVTLSAYDWRDRRVATKTGVETVEAGDVNRPLTWITYDNLDRPLTTSLFDGDGVPLSVGSTPVRPVGSLLRDTQATAYDAQGRAYRTQEFWVDQMTGAVGPSLDTNVFYDRRGNVALTTVPDGPAVQNRYDGAGRLTASFTLGNVPQKSWDAATSLAAAVVLEQTEYAYDAAGNTLLQTTRQRFHDAIATATGPLGTPTSGIPARVSFTARYYDSGSRLTATVDVGTNGGLAFARPATIPARSDTTLVTSSTYDAAGRVQDVTDPRGIVFRTLYDALDRTTATIANFTGRTAGGQTDVTTLWTFNTGGHLASRTAVQPAGLPSQTTSYLYGVTTAGGSGINSNDILASVLHPDPGWGYASWGEQDTFTVNALSERATSRDRNGTVHAYGYDVVGRPTSDSVTSLGPGVDGTILRTETAYDAAGRGAAFTSYTTAARGGTTIRNQIVRTFNGFGQIMRESQSHAGPVTATTPVVQYGFSSGLTGNHSRPTALTYPDGRMLTTGYTAGIDSAISRPSNIMGQAAVSQTALAIETFRYLGAGTVVERAHPEVNATLTLINPAAAVGAAGDKYTGLDRFGRVADQRWVRTAGSTTIDLDRFVYTYDRNGNPTSRSLPLNTAHNESYTYDGLNQLTSFARGGGAFPVRLSWQFDAAGNWQSHGTNAQNEVVMYGDRMLRYDATGNMVVDQAGRRLVYDAWNRLVQVNTAAGAAIVRYEYDPLGQRIVQRTGAGTAAEVRDFYYSTGWQVLEERVRTPAGIIPAAANTQYVWSPVSSDALIARDRNTDGLAGTGARGLEQRIYVLQDANWNVTSLVEAAGVPATATNAIINRFLYLPYGDEQVLSATWGRSLPNVVWQYLYQGLRVEAATGLALARNRDYSTLLGRFIERDPIGFAAGDNNLYRFVRNAPIGKTDPSGLCELVGAAPTLTVSGINPLPAIPSPLDAQAKEAARFADNVYDPAFNDDSPTRGGLLGKLGIEYQPTNGFQAALFRGSDGTYYLAFRGTEMFTRDMRRDIGTDIHQARSLTTSQFEQAIVLTQRVQQRIHELRGKLVLTGHSLGGGLAAAAAYATGLTADLFNPSWLSERYSRGTPGQIRSFITMGDELDALRRRVGGKVPGQAIYRPRKPGCSAISHFMAHFHD